MLLSIGNQLHIEMDKQSSKIALIQQIMTDPIGRLVIDVLSSNIRLVGNSFIAHTIRQEQKKNDMRLDEAVRERKIENRRKIEERREKRGERREERREKRREKREERRENIEERI